MILDQILEAKRIEVLRLKGEVPLGSLLDQLSGTEVVSFCEAMRRPDVNIIAEIKYRSPSHGPFSCQDPPEQIARGYADNGAAAISILTDEAFFGGSLRFLQQVSDDFGGAEGQKGRVPLLRKDFIIDRYQIVEARIAGASAFLLIAACLAADDLRGLLEAGREYGLDAVVEVHDSHELEAAVESGAKIIGVNNRDLRSFEVNVNTSFEIAREMEGESDYTLIAESGLSELSLIRELRDAGFSAFLIGTAFMDSHDPAERLFQLLNGELSD